MKAPSTTRVYIIVAYNDEYMYQPEDSPTGSGQVRHSRRRQQLTRAVRN